MKTRIIGAAILIFIAGIVCGVGIGRIFFPIKVVQPPQPPFPGGPPISANIWRMDLVKRLAKELGLTEEQTQKIDLLIKSGQERLKSLWDPIAPKAWQIIMETNTNIMEVLNPDQRLRFEEIIKKPPHLRGPPPRRGPAPWDGDETRKLYRTNKLESIEPKFEN